MSLIVVMLAMASGCRPADEPVVAAPPAPQPAPAPSPRPTQVTVDELLTPAEPQPGGVQGQEALNVIREVTPGGGVQYVGGQAVDQPIPARVVDRLIYQCTDDVTFAVRIVGDELFVFAPGYSNGYIRLERVVSDDGVHYASPTADFRAKDDLATLRVDTRRYVDCVSNPAAAVWQQLTP